MFFPLQGGPPQLVWNLGTSYGRYNSRDQWPCKPSDKDITRGLILQQFAFSSTDQYLCHPFIQAWLSKMCFAVQTVVRSEGMNLNGRQRTIRMPFPVVSKAKHEVATDRDHNPPYRAIYRGHIPGNEPHVSLCLDSRGSLNSPLESTRFLELMANDCLTTLHH